MEEKGYGRIFAEEIIDENFNLRAEIEVKKSSSNCHAINTKWVCHTEKQQKAWTKDDAAMHLNRDTLSRQLPKTILLRLVVRLPAVWVLNPGLESHPFYRRCLCGVSNPMSNPIPFLEYNFEYFTRTPERFSSANEKLSHGARHIRYYLIINHLII